MLLVPADAPGVSVRAHDNAWLHGSCGEVTFKDCRVPAGNLLGDDAAALLTGADAPGRGNPLAQALNLGIGRAAYEAALDYAHCACRAAARSSSIRRSAPSWPRSRSGSTSRAAPSGRRPGPPIIRTPSPTAACPICRCTTIAQVFTSETVMNATKDAAEMFGAMGVMRDMPLQKYIHDARVCLHTGDGNTDAKLRIAEELAGYRRAGNRAMALAGE